MAQTTLTSLRKNHFGLQLGFVKPHSNTTFLSFPSLARWSMSGRENVSDFCISKYKTKNLRNFEVIKMKKKISEQLVQLIRFTINSFCFKIKNFIF
jgi:hypothetical protein